MTNAQIEYIKESITTFNELIRINRMLKNSALKDGDFTEVSRCTGKITAYGDTICVLENLLGMK